MWFPKVSQLYKMDDKTQASKTFSFTLIGASLFDRRKLWNLWTDIYIDFLDEG